MANPFLLYGPRAVEPTHTHIRTQWKHVEVVVCTTQQARFACSSARFIDRNRVVVGVAVGVVHLHAADAEQAIRVRVYVVFHRSACVSVCTV